MLNKSNLTNNDEEPSDFNSASFLSVGANEQELFNKRQMAGNIKMIIKKNINFWIEKRP